MDAYLGAIFAFGFNFAPSGPGSQWALCNGAKLTISDNTILYSLIGTTYGGDGISTFCLPDLRGAVPIGAGQGQNMQNYTPGQTGGSMSTSILSKNLVPHDHVPTVSIPVGVTSDSDNGTGMYFGVANSNAGLAYETTWDTIMATNTMSTSIAANSNPPLDTVNPYMVVNFCICVKGSYPPRPNG